jgi:hypothetical protein
MQKPRFMLKSRGEDPAAVLRSKRKPHSLQGVTTFDGRRTDDRGRPTVFSLLDTPGALDTHEGSHPRL